MNGAGASAASTGAGRVAPRSESSPPAAAFRSTAAPTRWILTTFLNAVLGMLFWVAAARLYPAEIVGLGAGGISALQLAATIGWVGLIFTLMRGRPGRRRDARRRLVLAVYGAGVAAAAASAARLRRDAGDAVERPIRDRRARAQRCVLRQRRGLGRLHAAGRGKLISLRRGPARPGGRTSFTAGSS